MEWFAYRITGTTEYHFSSGTQYMNAVYDLKFLRAKTVMITVKSASRDQLSISSILTWFYSSYFYIVDSVQYRLTLKKKM